MAAPLLWSPAGLVGGDQQPGFLRGAVGVDVPFVAEVAVPQTVGADPQGEQAAAAVRGDLDPGLEASLVVAGYGDPVVRRAIDLQTGVAVIE